MPTLKTVKRGGVINYRELTASPSVGASLWETCPLLAVACDPVGFHRYREDFDKYVAGDWTITTIETGAGDATEALADEAGGVLLITNDAADLDRDEFQKKGESFKLASGKALWYETRFKISDATLTDVVVGLCITDITVVAGVTDGVYFTKADGSTAYAFKTTKNSTTTTTSSVATAAANTYIRLGFYFDGDSTVYGYANGALVATHTANICDDEELTVTFAIRNGEAAAKTMSVDLIDVVQYR